MVAESSTRRGDEQLESILYETANWTVNGGQGIILCEVASLRLAIDKATQFSVGGSEVVAVIRRRSPEIVVLSDQIRKVASLLADSQSSMLQSRTASAQVTEGKSEGDLSFLTSSGAGYHDVTALDAFCRK